MKRSEVIKILRDSFILNMNSQEVLTGYEMYSNILQDLEESGVMKCSYDSSWYDEELPYCGAV